LCGVDIFIKIFKEQIRKYFKVLKKQMKIKSNVIKNKKGFSLIELMVVVAILGIIILGLVTFFTGGTKSWVAGQSQLKAQREARQAMDRMVREIREGKNVKLGSDGDTIVILDIDLSEKVFRRDGFTLRESSSSLIENLIDKNYTTYPIFKYYNETVEVSPDGSNVSKVHIELEIDIDKDRNPDITLNSDVNLRNYGL